MLIFRKMKTCKAKLLVVLALVVLVTLLVATVAYASAQYDEQVDEWPESPKWGSWSWSNHTTSVDWTVYDLWDTTSLNWFLYGYERLGNLYRFEQEAYDPGGGTDCDLVGVYYVDNYNLPLNSYSIHNGCGYDSIEELVHLYPIPTEMSADMWYGHRVNYTKWNNPIFDAQVNYSFTYAGAFDDDWLGKLVYDNNFNKKYTDPSDL